MITRNSATMRQVSAPVITKLVLVLSIVINLRNLLYPFHHKSQPRVNTWNTVPSATDAPRNQTDQSVNIVGVFVSQRSSGISLASVFTLFTSNTGHSFQSDHFAHFQKPHVAIGGSDLRNFDLFECG